MADITASSRTVGSSMIIVLRRHDGRFSTNAAWRIERWYGYFSGSYWVTECGVNHNSVGIYDLFSAPKTGIGVLSSDRRVLTITIQEPPEMFTLYTANLTKDFQSGIKEAGWGKRSSQLVNAMVKPKRETYGYDFSPMSALVLLRESDRWTYNEKGLGKLFDDSGNIVAYLPAVGFDSIETFNDVPGEGNCSGISGPAGYWNGGFIFPETLWVGGVVQGSLTLAIEAGGSVVRKSVVSGPEGLTVPSVPTVYQIDWSSVFFSGIRQLSTSRYRD